ncbi:MAG: hypothetical protein WAV27_22060, partial [Xanthobacteraceae bacterium]
TVSATSDSIIVKPPSDSAFLLNWHNLGHSCQPIHQHSIASADACQIDDPAARHAGGKEANGRTGQSLVTTCREHHLHRDILRELQNPAGGSRLKHTSLYIDRCCDLSVLALCGGMVGVKQCRGLDGISLDRGHGRRARHLRQRNGR